MQYGSQARRSDIDGLRAVAVIAVLAFHLDANWLPGGYLGVDVFFTISGFLIVSIILRDLDNGSFSFGQFYERRIRRLLPPLLPVVAFCLVATWFLFLVPEYTDFAKSALAMTAQASNIYFLFTSGYFDNSESVKPLLHTWSLAIEEQFYLATPLVLYLTRNYRSRQEALILGILFVSLTLYAFQTINPASNLDVVFYSTLTRAWQLSAGAVIALVARRRPDLQMPAAARAIALAGLIHIVIVGHPAGRTLLDPRYLATLYSFILVFPPRLKNDFATKVLGASPFQFFGSISYGLYLWHWPLIVFSSIIFASNKMLVPPVVIAASIILATLSLRWLERPVLTMQLVHTRKGIVGLWLGAVGTITAVCLTIVLGNGLPGRLPPQVALAEKGITDTNPAWDRCFRPARWEQANIERINADDPCYLGKPDGKPVFVLVGDSHANALMPLFDQLAKEYGVTGVAALYSGCPPLLGVDHPFEVGRSCYEFNESVLRFVQRHNIQDIFMVAFWNHYLRAHVWDGPRTPVPTPPLMGHGQIPPRTSDEVDTLFRAALTATVERYSGRKLVVLGQTPPHAVSVPHEMVQSAILRRLPSILSISSDLAAKRLEPSRSIFAEFEARSKIRFIDPLPYLCATGNCAFEIDGKPLYYDDHHPSTVGAMNLRPIVEPAFREIVLGANGG
ncbi:acyltransferase family protein [Rhizobium sp. AG855]|uniref:acyltransferase family protein n=1 Tax=Rhizobium sp. AG855 TaxID=2183898 RepID=UPI000E72653B|nr:acyltransferase family protein [Rhizobium sp. AG855]RKE85556.1 peptidoglycan/LPS O-acetylase OafA/YrhL [Rhizobium sp. AG855]